MPATHTCAWIPECECAGAACEQPSAAQYLGHPCPPTKELYCLWRSRVQLMVRMVPGGWSASGGCRKPRRSSCATSSRLSSLSYLPRKRSPAWLFPSFSPASPSLLPYRPPLVRAGTSMPVLNDEEVLWRDADTCFNRRAHDVCKSC